LVLLVRRQRERQRFTLECRTGKASLVVLLS
jgi:hypothetical protein